MIRRFVLVALIGVAWSLRADADDKPTPAIDPAKAMAEMQQQFLQHFDVNKNGKLDGPEQLAAQEAMRQQGWNMGIAPGGFPGADQFNKQFDRDGDGKLSPMEMLMAQEAFRRMRGGQRLSGGVRTGGSIGGAVPPVVPIAPANSQKNGKVPPLIKRFDKDGDGKLNADEKAAAQAELKKEKGKDKAGK
jgi:EF hand